MISLIIGWLAIFMAIIVVWLFYLNQQTVIVDGVVARFLGQSFILLLIVAAICFK